MEHLSSATLDAIIFLILPTFVHKNNSLEISRFIKGQKKNLFFATAIPV